MTWLALIFMMGQVSVFEYISKVYKTSQDEKVRTEFVRKSIVNLTLNEGGSSMASSRIHYNDAINYSE